MLACRFFVGPARALLRPSASLRYVLFVMFVEETKRDVYVPAFTMSVVPWLSSKIVVGSCSGNPRCWRKLRNVRTFFSPETGILSRYPLLMS